MLLTPRHTLIAFSEPRPSRTAEFVLFREDDDSKIRDDDSNNKHII